jgi:replication factor A1
MDDEVALIYEKLKNVISEQEFLEKIEEKSEKMGPLCDRKTIALLVASDLGISGASNEPTKIADVTQSGSNVYVTGKIISVFEIREFSRQDGTTGKVGNAIIADDTGSIRLTLWDDNADLIATEYLKAGKSYQVSGYTKEGYSGLEINVGRSGNIQEANEDIPVKLPSSKIDGIKENDSDINVKGVILQVADIRTFTKRNGGEGKVLNILIGDETGKIRVTLWDEKTDAIGNLGIGDSVEIINGYARLNNYSDEVEIQVGTHGVIRPADSDVEYSEDFTPVSDIVPDENYSVKGRVSGIGEIREFNRKDGSIGLVSNIYISDDTGRIRVTLWDEMAEMAENVDIDTEMEIIDAHAKTGFNNEVELSTNRLSRLIFL